jgi:thiamine biosynthesis lipoprotein
MQSIEHRALGSHVLVLVDEEGARSRALLAAVPAWLDAREGRASRFRADSELSLLNARVEHAVSSELFSDIQAALAAARWTDGLVTPTVIDALEAAGYDAPFEQIRAGVKERRQAEPVPDYRDVVLDSATRRVELPTGARLDLGGSLKGRIADQLAARLGEHAPTLVDAGGDIAISGPRRDGSAWPIGVSDPDAPDRPLALLALRHGGVATSGRDFRRWKTRSGWAHHLIDPKSGRPAETDVLSATVVADTAARADVAAKVVLLLGCERGLEWIDAQDFLEAMLVGDSGTVRESRGFARFTWELE